MLLIGVMACRLMHLVPWWEILGRFSVAQSAIVAAFQTLIKEHASLYFLLPKVNNSISHCDKFASWTRACIAATFCFILSIEQVEPPLCCSVWLEMCSASDNLFRAGDLLAVKLAYFPLLCLQSNLETWWISLLHLLCRSTWILALESAWLSWEVFLPVWTAW